MESPVFYIDPESIHGETAFLDKDESHHLSKVMRLSKGSLVILVDGLSNGYRGEVVKIGHKNPVEVKILNQIRNFGEPETKITLACGLSTGHKIDTIIEKGTELGISRFVPLITEKSKIRLDDIKRLQSKNKRYYKVAIAAMKQCRRSYIPQISLPVKFDDYLKEMDPECNNLIFHPGSSISISDININDNYDRRISLIVGPESGFSRDEIDSAIQKKIQPVSLGQRVLRAETAAYVVCGIIMSKAGQLR